MAGAGFVELQKVDALIQEVNTDLSNRPIDPSTVASQIAWKRGGSGKIGVESIFTVPFFGNRAKKRSIYEEVPGTLPELAKFSVVHDEWAPDAEIIPRYTQLTDIYGLVKDNLPTILRQAAIEPDTQLAQLLGNGQSVVTKYDLKAFFHATDHEANPMRPGLKLFGNYATATALNRANIITALDELDAMPGPDGNLLAMPGKTYIVVSNERQLQAALTEVNMTYVPNSAGTATQENSLKGRVDGVIKLVQLRDYDSNKGWYVIKVADEKHRPFVVSMIQEPLVYLEGVSVDDHSQVLRAIARQGWRAVWGLGYLWPHLCIKRVEP